MKAQRHISTSKRRATSAHQSAAPHQHIKVQRHISTSKRSAASAHQSAAPH